jgi:hypothetical protein
MYVISYVLNSVAVWKGVSTHRSVDSAGRSNAHVHCTKPPSCVLARHYSTAFRRPLFRWGSSRPEAPPWPTSCVSRSCRGSMFEYCPWSLAIMIHYLVNDICMSSKKMLSTKPNWFSGSNLKLSLSCSRKCCPQRSVELIRSRSWWYVLNLAKGYPYFDPEDSISKNKAIQWVCHDGI